MKNYNIFTAAEFIEELSFTDWVLHNTPINDLHFKNWLNENQNTNAELKKAVLFLKNLKANEIDISDEYIENKITEFWEKSEHHTIRKNRFSFANKNMVWLVAASVLMVLGLSYFFFNENPFVSQKLYSLNFIDKNIGEKIVNNNESSKPIDISLPDGSKINLKPNSSIKYLKTFIGETREIELVGEAFFDVKPNPDIPFIVHFNDLVVKVLGTSFLIKAPKNKNKMQVVVKTGKVSVFEKDDWQKIMGSNSLAIKGVVITANQQVEYQNETAKFEKNLIDSPIIIDNKTLEQDFVFDETALKIVFDKLENAYGIRIIVDENQIKNCTITASLSDESLSEKLRLICKIINANYETIDGQIIINTKSCKN